MSEIIEESDDGDSRVVGNCPAPVDLRAADWKATLIPRNSPNHISILHSRNGLAANVQPVSRLWGDSFVDRELISVAWVRKHGQTDQHDSLFPIASGSDSRAANRKISDSKLLFLSMSLFGRSIFLGHKDLIVSWYTTVIVTASNVVA